MPAATILALAQHLCRKLVDTAYDCLNLALAEKGCGLLLTKDQRLMRKVQAVPQASGLVMALDALELSG